MGGIVIKSPDLDEVWEIWKKKNANNSKFRKLYEVKGAAFSIDKISAAEWVKNVDKGAIMYAKISTQIAPSGKAPTKFRQTADKIEKITFFEFKSKDIDKSGWKYDEEVPFFSTLKQTPCSKCSGKGGVKCQKCKGTGKVTCPECTQGLVVCKNCAGKGKVDVEITVLDESGKKRKVTKQVICEVCHGKGKVPCKTCQGTGKVLCNKCIGTGYVDCDSCKGSGYFFDYEVRPIPFKRIQSSNNLFFSSMKMDKDLKSAMNTDLERVLERIGYIPIKSTKDINKKFINANLGYLTKDIWKMAKDASSELEKAEKNPDKKVVWPVYLIPLMVLQCSSPKKKNYSIFVIGTDKKFEVYGSL